MKRNYYVIDCRDFTLGRAASRAAVLLRGKQKRDFSPEADNGDFVIVVNSDDIKTTGKKTEKKTYYKYSGYPGGVSSKKLEKALADDSRKVIAGAVYGMLPKNKLRDKMMKRLRVFKNDKHNTSHKLEGVKP